MATATLPASAKAIVQQTLDQYGLGSLINWAWGLYTSSGGGQSGTDAITAELPNQAAFKTRFPAYETLAKEGRAMTVSQMINYEQTARQIFQANGIPGGFYDTPDQLAKFMLSDVSTTELESRVQDAQKATLDAPQDVRDQLSRMYGIGTGAITAHFLDPTVAEPLLQQQFTASQIAAEAQRTGFGQINKGVAENLTQLGVTDSTAQSGFNKLGTEQGLFQQQTAGEQAIGQPEQIAAQFAGNAQAQQAFLTRQATRVSQFNEDTAVKAGTKGFGGLGTSDTSVPG